MKLSVHRELSCGEEPKGRGRREHDDGRVLGADLVDENNRPYRVVCMYV